MSSSVSETNSRNLSYDNTSGQDAAFQKGGQLLDAQSAYFQQLMGDPMASVATLNRIRQLQSYLNAFRGGGNLPDQEVIPMRRLQGESYSHSSSTSNSAS